MLLLELTTLTIPSKARDMGLNVSKTDMIRARTYIDLEKMSHYIENSDDLNLTNITMITGHTLVADISVEELTNYLAGRDKRK
jgi:hypothetical protein